MNEISGLQIRRAQPSDAPRIYELKRAAFGETFLEFTIYQSPKSVGYLRALIEEGMLSHNIFVAERADRVLGYYHAFHRAPDFFLNYIAVAPEAQGCGLGKILLKHFEAAGRASSHRSLMMDVFESNQAALAWYQRAGYHSQTAHFLAKLAMSQGADCRHAPLVYDHDAEALAYSEERAHGFSKIECTSGPGHIVVGLVDERFCKLLEYKRITFESAIAAICQHWSQDREALLLTLPPDYNLNWSFVRLEKLMRLVKTC
jgi:ribosomal protein S18 acetylase RimI-like enzyme